ncbi:hypothetical protein [Bacillus cereus]|uniref:hypothetical protein n=1 Tax=Bacillus cereus TaxID=1396 RepID=UPI0015B8608C|nr:hypothetical protein [Bacillus cereus]
MSDLYMLQSCLFLAANAHAEGPVIDIVARAVVMITLYSFVFLPLLLLFVKLVKLSHL